MHNILYYEDDSGNSPVIEFLRMLPTKDRAKVLWEIDLLQEFGTKLTLPHVKKMVSQDNLWELRIKISSNNYRVFYFHHINDTFVLLHGFTKKTQKTPTRELDTALRRKQNFLERNDK